MLKWLLKMKIKSVVENELAGTRLTLSTMRLLLNNENSDLTIFYGEGIDETAGLLAQRFHISVPNALEARGLDWRQLDDAYKYVMKHIGVMLPYLQSESETIRTDAHR